MNTMDAKAASATPTHQKNSTWDAFTWGSKLQLPTLASEEPPLTTGSNGGGAMPTHRRGASMPPNLEEDELPPIRYDDLVPDRPRLGHRTRNAFSSLGGDSEWTIEQVAEPPPVAAVPHHRRGGSNPMALTLGGLDLYGTDSLLGMLGPVPTTTATHARPQHRRSVTFQGTSSSSGENNMFRMDQVSKQDLQQQQPQSEPNSPPIMPRQATPPPPPQQQQHHSPPQQHQSMQYHGYPSQQQQYYEGGYGDYLASAGNALHHHHHPHDRPPPPQQHDMQMQLQMQQALIVQQQQWLLAMQQQQQQQLLMQQQGQRRPSPVTATPVMVPQFAASPPASVSPLVRYQPKMSSPMQVAAASTATTTTSADIVLAEYKSTGQRPRIEDLRGHVHAFASDAHGSRFLQYQMEIAKPEEKDALVKESLPHALQLMQDTFGNYVIQNFLEHSTSGSRRLLADTMKGSMLQLSMQPHGCRVVQRALDLVDIDQRNALLHELLVPRGNVFQASRNTHATHVLQKTVSILRRDSVLEDRGESRLLGSADLMRAMEKAVADDVCQLLLHPHAYRLVLNVLGDCDSARSVHVKRAVDIIAENRDMLCVDQHGNFMLQHMLDNKQGDSVLDFVKQRLVELSQHKFGSHLVEKCFAVATEERCAELVEELLRPTHERNIKAAAKLKLQVDTQPLNGVDTPALALMKDPYANFVVQKAFDRCAPGALKSELTTLVQDNAEVLQKFTYGRHILAHVMASRNNAATSPVLAPVMMMQPQQTARGRGGYYPRGGGGGGGRGGGRNQHQ